MGAIRKVEQALLRRTLNPIIKFICQVTGLKPAGLLRYSMALSMFFALPTASQIGRAVSPLVEFSAVVLISGVLAFLALSPRIHIASKPVWRLFLWCLILENVAKSVRSDFQPFTLLMWIFMLLAEYIGIFAK